MKLDFLLVEPTGRCGLRCPLCPTGAGRTPRTDTFLDPALLHRFLADVAPARPRVGMWGWGEPTLHPDLAGLVRVAHAHGCGVEIQSNGHGRIEDYDALIEAGLEQLTIALDGLDDTQMRPLRGRTADAGVVRAVLASLAPRRGCTDVVVQCIVTRPNEAHLPAIAAWVGGLGLRLELKTLNTAGAGPGLIERLRPTREALRRPGTGPGSGCPFLAAGATLLADGAVVPCCYDWEGRWPLGHAGAGWQSLAAARASVDPGSAPLCNGCAMSGLALSPEATCAS